MNKSEEKLTSRELKKAKIRERYKGINQDEIEVIPALPQIRLDDPNRTQRVAVYARVSTDDPNQTSSYELQRNHYQDLVNSHINWILVDIYADEGISGTSLKHRDSFIRMINDCRAGKIDLIITKSVARFARNVVDCIKHVRELAALNPPVAVFFETENIYTLNPNSEMSLSFISTLAQEESHTKSEIMNASIEMRFKRGIFLTPPLLGYDKDEDGNLVINEEEAKTVRLIFFMYLYGFSAKQIAEEMTLLKRVTKKGNTTWSSSTILSVLQNERHCGDIIARKTYTPNFLDHKSKRNNHDRNQYHKKDHHDPIISREDFIAVQRLINNAKYGTKDLLPKLNVISDGSLKGYVLVNTRWAAFTKEDYMLACKSQTDQDTDTTLPVRVNSGDFDLRGFEVARSQFFTTLGKVFLTFSLHQISFSRECVRKFDSNYVEFLIQPYEHILAIRPCSKDSKNGVQWSRKSNGKIIPRAISGSAYLPTLFELFGWNPELKYKLTGTKRDSYLFFTLSDTEVFIPPSQLEECNSEKGIIAYPKDWVQNFGEEYYSVKTGIDTNFDIPSTEVTYKTDEAMEKCTSPEELKEKINVIKETLYECNTTEQ